VATSVRLPQWGMGMQEGTILRWHKREGDDVEEDEPLCDVDAAKTEQALESPASGVLARILVAEGETVPVLTELAVIVEPGEELPA
jgi:pyruvate/2-oxoglutarate dehydrogenase complex dihydrolipoamide acyltransferase (E2) component